MQVEGGAVLRRNVARYAFDYKIVESAVGDGGHAGAWPRRPATFLPRRVACHGAGIAKDEMTTRSR
jgi:hypothetical protein